ncbi:hypothetical protein H2248_006814 [Termitomyces sp. 'cryptogamus']|nr:hypothetical protein H2248_006814 [Termitomyces sp. 'cryptogamus']
MAMVTQKTEEDTKTSYRVKTTDTGEDNKPPVVESTMWMSCTPTAKEWDACNAWMLSLIINNCRNSVSLGIRMGGTAAEAWEALTSTYSTISDLVAMGAENCLHTTMYTDSADFLLHITDLHTKWQEAVENGTMITNATFHTVIMNSLLESWNTIIASMCMTMTSAPLIAGLSVHWKCLRMQKQASAIMATALQAVTKLQRSGIRGGRKEGQFPQDFRNQDKALAALKAAKKVTPTPTENKPTANLADTMHPHATYALMAKILLHDPVANDSEDQSTPDTTPVSALQVTGPILTYADPGASDHCFVERHAFLEYKELSIPQQSQSAPVGGVFCIISQGTV